MGLCMAHGKAAWLKQRAVKTSVSTVLLLVFGVTPAAATHDSVPCPIPEQLQPLFNLMHALTELAMLAGVGLGTLGFMFAGICYIIPGQKWNNRGRNVGKHVFLGVIILLSARMIVAFLTSQMGGVVCG